MRFTPPENVAPPDRAMWLGRGQLAVVTWGSSGCPGLPDRLDVPSPDQLTVTVQQNPPDGSCTADLAATTSVVKVPATLVLGAPVTVTIVDRPYGSVIPLSPWGGSDG
jgi:hypothetical protein